MLRFPLGAGLIALSLVTVACGGGGTSRPTGPEKIKVGLLLDSLVEERWQRDRDLFVERVKELGGEAIVKAANRDAALQEQQARELLNQGVKALVIVASDTEKAAAIVAAANGEEGAGHQLRPARSRFRCRSLRVVRQREGRPHAGRVSAEPGAEGQLPADRRLAN
jgi:hypothetical protein